MIRWTDEMIGKLGTKSDMEIARELGISPSTVRSKREVLGIPNRKVYQIPENTPEEAILHGQSDYMIQKKFGVYASKVREMRAKLKTPAVPIKIGTKLEAMEKWVQWDEANNHMISVVFGVSSEYVRQVRESLLKPESDKKWKPEKVAEFEAWALERSDEINNLTIDEIKYRFSQTITTSMALMTLRRNGLSFKRRNREKVRPWDVINWDLPNTALRDIWRHDYIAGVRSRCGKGPAKFVNRSNDAGVKRIQYESALLKEKQLAADWFKEHPLAFPITVG